MELTVLQLNLNRCRAAHDLLEQTTVELKADIVLISEPYVNKSYWYTDTAKCSAIWVPPHTLRRVSTLRPVHSGHGYVAIQLDNTLIVSCYFAPSLSHPDFCRALNEIEEVIMRNPTREIMIGGDFNAKSPMWGSRLCDKRGASLMCWTGKNNIITVRSEGKATFHRNGRSSLIDIMMCNQASYNRLSSSKILDNYSASDHSYLLHHFKPWTATNQAQRAYTSQDSKLDMRLFADEYDNWTRDMDVSQPVSVHDLNKYIAGLKDLVEACRLVKNKALKGKNEVWWWTKEIAELRKKAISCRRRLHRAYKKGNAQSIEVLRCEYKTAKRMLNKAIKKAKMEGWEFFINQIDADIWGRPYRSVVKSIKGSPSPVVLGMDQVDDIVKSLFVMDAVPQAYMAVDPWRNFVINGDNDIGAVEVTKAIARIKKKAIGPDGIPMELLR